MDTIQNIAQLNVENFGAIQQANIDLRPLTVFVGPNNTGKSYLATLIYALHCYFGSDSSRFFLKSRRELRRLLGTVLPEGTATLEESLSIIGKQLQNVDVKDLQGSVDIMIPEPLAHILRQMLRESIGFGLNDEISRCFGLNTESLRRWGPNHRTKVTLRTRPFEDTDPLEHHLTWETGHQKALTVVPSKMPLMLRRELLHLIPPSGSWFFSPQLERGDTLKDDSNPMGISSIQLLEFIAYCLSVSLYGPFSRSAHYLPADRTGVMHAHKSIVSSVLKNTSLTGAHQMHSNSLLSGVLVDFLEGMIFSEDMNVFLSEMEQRPQKIIHVCKMIEEEILNGTIKIDYSEVLSYPQFSYQPTDYNESLPLKSTSSMISELAPILLYLRCKVDYGDVLIIEEPEAHLHPSMQVSFARQLVALVNSGVRVIVTTHSKWILDELANLVKQSSPSAADRANIDGSSVALSPDKVGVWLFQEEKHRNGATVLQMDPDQIGLYPST